MYTYIYHKTAALKFYKLNIEHSDSFLYIWSGIIFVYGYSLSWCFFLCLYQVWLIIDAVAYVIRKTMGTEEPSSGCGLGGLAVMVIVALYFAYNVHDATKSATTTCKKHSGNVEGECRQASTDTIPKQTRGPRHDGLDNHVNILSKVYIVIYIFE